MPLIIGGFGAALSLLQLIVDVTRQPRRRLRGADRPAARIMPIYLWVWSFVIAVTAFGFVMAAPVMLFVYLRFALTRVLVALPAAVAGGSGVSLRRVPNRPGRAAVRRPGDAPDQGLADISRIRWWLATLSRHLGADTAACRGVRRIIVKRKHHVQDRRGSRCPAAGRCAARAGRRVRGRSSTRARPSPISWRLRRAAGTTPMGAWWRAT